MGANKSDKCTVNMPALLTVLVQPLTPRDCLPRPPTTSHHRKLSGKELVLEDIGVRQEICYRVTPWRVADWEEGQSEIDEHTLTSASRVNRRTPSGACSPAHSRVSSTRTSE